MICRQNNTIEDATRTIFETEEVGLGTMSELQRQRDVLQSASDKAKDTISLSMQANSILNVFWILLLIYRIENGKEVLATKVIPVICYMLIVCFSYLKKQDLSFNIINDKRERDQNSIIHIKCFLS